ncbi:cobalamin biosynthesis protein [Aestuariicella sp. G3-2]|uniref:adenosylcobinamide-phosphate synthase CbiB n=1 Tax=Pseudomaricurvus albidus TaxID=2842452 RepID=UPI001C0D1105|nr:adenosylcobinamide-phosphate synthase CbiB [Aestuariicella albida]MBU3069691.1 cobalamin biosynthesis protein [Aestuariicella albida]
MLTVTVLAVAVILAFLLDRLLGEPRRLHPLVGFGNLAMWLERRCNWWRGSESVGRLVLGGLAWLLLVVPLPLMIALVWFSGELSLLAEILLAVIALYLSIGWQSLREHGLSVVEAFSREGLEAAREQVSRIVSRDTDAMDESAVSRATIESMLENGSDAIFAPFFWFILAGPAGAVMYRLANTLDAMWGYRTERYAAFGFVSAKLDDLLNWAPARLTALSYALLGHTATALRCWKQQAADCASPNGGPVMCSGAGGLGIELGGGAYYHGQWQSRPTMGAGRAAVIRDINRSIQLVDKTVMLWIGSWLTVWIVIWVKGSVFL